MIERIRKLVPRPGTVDLKVDTLRPSAENFLLYIEKTICSTPGRCRSKGGFSPGEGVLDFGLDRGVPPGPRDPNPCLEVKKVPMFRDFAQKMDPCLRIF